MSHGYDDDMFRSTDSQTNNQQTDETCDADDEHRPTDLDASQRVIDFIEATTDLDGVDVTKEFAYDWRVIADGAVIGYYDEEDDAREAAANALSIEVNTARWEKTTRQKFREESETAEEHGAEIRAEEGYRQMFEAKQEDDIPRTGDPLYPGFSPQTNRALLGAMGAGLFGFCYIAAQNGDYSTIETVALWLGTGAGAFSAGYFGARFIGGVSDE